MNKAKIGLLGGKRLFLIPSSLINLIKERGLIVFIIAVILVNFIFASGHIITSIRAQSTDSSVDLSQPKDLYVIQGNSLAPISSPALAPLYPSLSYKTSYTCNRMEVLITGYSSVPEQTDDTPFITASGKTVKDGIIANNLLPFGTKVKIPALYGDKVFEVQDRMHWSKKVNQIDIWFPSTIEAKIFGVKKTYIEIIE